MTTSPKHRYAPALLVAALLLAAAVAIYPFDYTLSDSIRAFSRSVGKSYIFQEVLALLRPFGKGDVVLVIVAALGICGLRKRATHIILALLVLTILIYPFKWGVGRERPGYSNSHSFPSGDAATAAAFCMPLLTASPWGAPIAVVLNAGVATGRVYDGRHFPSDVLAGIAFGVIASVIAAAILRRWPWEPKRRWFAIIGGSVILFSVINLIWARATPFVLDFLRIWGPLGSFLVLARWIPTWIHKRKGSWNPSRTFGFIAFLVFTIYLTITTASSLWDRDEPRFSRATVEMVESGNYLYPTFNDQLRADKPILIYWLMSIPVRIFGVSEMSCRMVAPFASLVAALLTFWIARRLFDPKIAFWAGLMLMLTPLLTVSGTAATTDALLLACITGAIASFMLSWLNGFRLWHLVLLIVTLGAALLTKGPVGLAVPLLAIIAILIFAGAGSVKPWRYVGWLLFAAIASSILFLSWGLPANAATHGEFYRLGIEKHVVSRSLNAMESHGGKSFIFYFYYIPVVILTFFPWILYLPRIFVRPTDSSAQEARHRRLLFCWAIPILLLMSVVATKLPHYILPAWPAFAMAAALGLRQAIRTGRQGNDSLSARIGLGCFLTIGFVLGLSLTIVPWVLAKLPLFGIRVPATIIGLVFLAMTGISLHFYRKALHEYAAGILSAGMIVVLLSASLFLLPAIEPLKLSPLISQVIQLNTPPTVPVFTCGYGEPTLNFYLGRSPITSLEGPDLPGWATAPGPGVLVVTEGKFMPYLAAFNGPRIETLDMIPGFNYSQGKQVMIHIIFRNGTP